MKNHLNVNLLRTMLREWRWIFGYIKKYRVTIFIYILFGVIASVISVGGTVASKFLIDAVMSKDRVILIRSASVVVVFLISQILFQAISSRITVSLSTRVGTELRNDIFSRAHRFWISFSYNQNVYDRT